MLTHDELRKRLRAADSADHRTMPDAERIRMRAMLQARASRATARPRLTTVFALATAAAAIVTILAMIPAGERTDPAPTAEIPTTRIYFTGPDGTKIQWFVTNPSKELGS